MLPSVVMPGHKDVCISSCGKKTLHGQEELSDLHSTSAAQLAGLARIRREIQAAGTQSTSASDAFFAVVKSKPGYTTEPEIHASFQQDNVSLPTVGGTAVGADCLRSPALEYRTY